ncbi:hypothetical protein BH09VER1_BH09VER1_16150 [soil metagenome]
MNDTPTIQSVVDSLAEDLKGYLEAQYHVRDEAALNERRALLDSDATIAQIPFLESTPAYSLTKPYGELVLPDKTRELLSAISTMKAGLYPRPYLHQAQALQAFIGDKKNILAATGTGSGKTEIFLLSILASMAEESSLGGAVTKQFGCRALILYPMNALVSDQLARLRILFGNPGVVKALKELRGRVARFAMYTSRTPFPGTIPSERNHERAAALLKRKYQPILQDPEYLKLLIQRGKWPAKDVEAFFGKSGMNWLKRLKTATDDVELLMRHEIQAECPDVLVTNYSMLEYMLVRPIERPIFEQTRRWLASDPRTFFTIVLDEAHMYRGATGAEVSFLLRRLIQRLDIPRERVRFILTTASVGSTQADEEAAMSFACDLTSLPRTDKGKFAYVTGARESFEAPRAATVAEGKILADFDGGAFQDKSYDDNLVRPLIGATMLSLGAPIVDSAKLSDDLFSALSVFGPAGLLVNTISGNATPLTEVAKIVFPECDATTSGKALDSLVRLCNYAKEEATGKVFLPARVHLFFRGLSGLFTCSNSECSEKRVATESPLLGRMYSEPMVACGCGSRVYEVFTHRDCGAIYLRCYVSEHHPRPDFAWHEPTTTVRPDASSEPLKLTSMHLLVSRSKPDFDGWQPCWLQISSGKLVWKEPSGEGWLAVFAPDETHRKNRLFGGKLFGVCPSCSKTTQRTDKEPSKIMDLRTKGEQPFGQLIKRQLFSQPADRGKDILKFPNQGRKTLIFSDGRQKAARLAKTLPEEVEADAFREILALGYSLIQKPHASIPLTKSYALFVAACAQGHIAPYSGGDHEKLVRDIDSFEETFLGDVESWYSDGAVTGPSRFLQNLYRQITGGLYSLRFICAGSIWPLQLSTNRLRKQFPTMSEEDAIAIAGVWLQDLAREVAIDKELSKNDREVIQGFRSGAQSWAHDGKFPGQISTTLTSLGFDVQALERAFIDMYTIPETEGSGYYLQPNLVSLVIDLKRPWYRCRRCKSDSLTTIQGHCTTCGCAEIDEVDPVTDPYVRTRKGFWRLPIEEVLSGIRLPRLLSAEEHTAQLTHSDPSTGSTIIEDYELRFQDILRGHELPIDVLSCTTTMEAGVDIGSLEAVGLRNVPPQRENYQQRAGRSGRRGSAISTVVTYCQGNPHDNFYYQNVNLIASGSPRELIVKSDNPKIARRHVHAFLLQGFFGTRAELHTNADILSSLGGLIDFYQSGGEISKEAFIAWVNDGLKAGLAKSISGWISSLNGITDIEPWAKKTCQDFCDCIETLSTEADEVIIREALTPDDQKTDLLKFFLDESLLPSYAFPTNLSAFQVEEVDASTKGVSVIYRPTQSATRALSEYAPGRIITIDKNDFLSAAVVAHAKADNISRARPLFDNPHRRPYVFCSELSCCYVEDVGTADASFRSGIPCPLCAVGTLRVMEMISPEVYLPAGSVPISALDDEPEITKATPAQFPVPIHQTEEKLEAVGELSELVSIYRREQAELVVVNKGDPAEQLGFEVCKDCGLSHVAGHGRNWAGHRTPYLVQEKPGRTAGRRQCHGERATVFLGHRFSTDLSIIRADVAAPLCQLPHGLSADFLALQSALQTISEALTLGAAKFFDVDYTEFSAGYRLIQQTGQKSPIVAELYMFDTLSGGAGYSQQLADSFQIVLKKHVYEILKCSDADGTGCDRSCHRCLRHYHNQFHHTNLDRHLADDLLRFLLDGAPLQNPRDDTQEKLLKGLADMLTFDGIEVEPWAVVDGVSVPLLAKGRNHEAAVCVTHSLVAPIYQSGLVDELDGSDTPVCSLNEFFLTRNLPAAFLSVKKCLGE